MGRLSRFDGSGGSIQGVNAQAARDAATAAVTPPIVNAHVKQLDDLRALCVSLTMEIHFSGAGPPYDAMMPQAVETVDWARIEALLR